MWIGCRMDKIYTLFSRKELEEKWLGVQLGCLSNGQKGFHVFFPQASSC